MNATATTAAVGGRAGGIAPGDGILAQVLAALDPAEGEGPGGTGGRAAEALFRELAPDGAEESILAAQMVAAHEAVMGGLAQSRVAELPRSARATALRLVARFMSLTCQQVAALDRLRGRRAAERRLNARDRFDRYAAGARGLATECRDTLKGLEQGGGAPVAEAPPAGMAEEAAPPDPRWTEELADRPPPNRQQRRAALRRLKKQAEQRVA